MSDHQDSNQKIPSKSQSAKDDLAHLSAKLEAEKQARMPKPQKKQGGKALGMRIATDFIAGILFGIFSGYYLDKWLDSQPWGLIVMTILGFAGGIRNAMRTSEEFDKKMDNQ